MTIWTDDQLLEYLAGNLADTSARALETDVATDARLEKRLIAIDPFGPCVKDAFLAMPGIQDCVDFQVPDAGEITKAPRWFALL